MVGTSARDFAWERMSAVNRIISDRVVSRRVLMDPGRDAHEARKRGSFVQS
jgi:hypothetical protein